ncbi:hypothetical protein BB561_003457 [Smittium simulii]|uniref:Uncharacterized protein n=1 Tax=Smittium simulii TaxID=133385 RepID=A0A2T9YLA1_9FUNG|nr:hypothetical protein BB561_003457 [Smittium simulii]
MKREQQSVQQIQAMGAQDSECDNSHKRVRASMVEIESYPRLIECSKFLGMKYTPPPLNEAATSAKLNDPAIRIKGNNDLEYTHLMRELLSYTNLNPLVENKQLNALLASKNIPAKNKSRKKSLFCLRQQNAYGTAPAAVLPLKTSSKLQPIQQIISRRIMAEIFKQNKKTRALTRATNVFPIEKEFSISERNAEFREARGFVRNNFIGFRVIKTKCNQLLSSDNSSSALLQAENEQGSQQRNYQGAEKLQNGITDIHMQDNQKEKLHGVFRSRRRLYACSDTSEMQYISLLSMEWKSFSILSPTFWPLTESYTFTKLARHAQKICKLYWKGTSNISSPPSWLPDVEVSGNPGTEKLFFKEIEIMGCNSEPKQSSHSKYRILETETDNMEWLIIPIKNFRNIKFYRCQQHSMRNSCEIPILLEFIVFFNSINSYKHQEIISITQTALQHYTTGIRPKISGGVLSQITRSFRKIVVALHENKHTTPDGVCTHAHQPCQYIIEADSSNRMIPANRNIQEIVKYI